MSLQKKCNKCGKKISLRKMPNGYWIPFDYYTDTPHKCNANTKSKVKAIKEGATSNKAKSYSHNSFHSPSYINPDSEQTILPLIRSAIANKDNLNITYFTTSRSSWSSREITPYKVYSNPDGIYLEAYCYLRQEKRTFRLDKIKSAQTIVKTTSNQIAATSNVTFASNTHEPKETNNYSSFNWGTLITVIIILSLIYIAIK